MLLCCCRGCRSAHVSMFHLNMTTQVACPQLKTRTALCSAWRLDPLSRQGPAGECSVPAAELRKVHLALQSQPASAPAAPIEPGPREPDLTLAEWRAMSCIGRVRPAALSS